MVRFGDNYAAHIDREYGVNSYINYDKLKKNIHKKETQDNEQKNDDDDSEFSALFNAEILRIEQIFLSKMQELDNLFVHTQKLAMTLENTRFDSKHKKKAHEAALKRISTLLYIKLLKLENFRLVNYTAVIKILKKHDKVLVPLIKEMPLFDDLMDTVNRYNFGHGSRSRTMISQVELLYANAFCGGLIQEAQNKLHIVKGSGKNKSGLYVAFKVGVIFTLLVWLIYDFAIYPNLAAYYLGMEDPAVYVYAVVTSLVVYRWIWGFNIFMWEYAGIDYILLLDLDAVKHMPTYNCVLSEAADCSILLLINMLTYNSLQHFQNKQLLYGILSHYPYILPLSLAIGTIVYILQSAVALTSYGVFSTRVFLSLITVPFSKVQLRESFAGDILTSFAKVLSASAYATCYFVSGTFLTDADNNDTAHDLLNTAHFAATCKTESMHLLATCLCVWPALVRLLQNIRQLHDHYQRHRSIDVNSLNNHNSIDQQQTTTVVTNQCSNGNRRKVMPLTTTTTTAVNATSNNSNSNGNDCEGGYHQHCRYCDNSNDTNCHHNNLYFDNHILNDHDDSDDEDNTVAAAVADDYIINMVPTIDIHQTGDTTNTAALFSHNECNSPEPDFLARWRVYIRHKLPTRLQAIYSNTIVWPYSFNALKYILQIMVVIFGAYPPLAASTTAGSGGLQNLLHHHQQQQHSSQNNSSPFIIYWTCYCLLCVLSTIYSSYWDVVNDWGLLQLQPPKPLLRELLYYRDLDSFYYMVMILNPILRSFWTLSFTPFGGQAFFVLFEIFRRCLWSCLRMELAYIQELKKRH